jgi:hypothetical protein
MNRKHVSLGFLGILLSAALLLAASKPLGRWECTSSTPGGSEMKWTLTVKEVDGKLVGTAGSDDGEIEIEDAKFENDTLSFKVTHDSGSYEVILKIDGDKLDGNWKGGGETGTIKGAKKA